MYIYIYIYIYIYKIHANCIIIHIFSEQNPRLFTGALST